MNPSGAKGSRNSRWVWAQHGPHGEGVSKATRPRNGRRVDFESSTQTGKLERLELSLWQRNATVIVFRNSQNMHVQILTRAVQTGGLFRGSCATSQQRCAQDRCQDYGDATSRPTGYRVGLLQGVVVWPPFWLPFLVRLRARNRTPTAQHPFQARAYHDRTVAGLLQTSARDMGFDSPRYLSP
jgi:hypothetical protein